MYSSSFLSLFLIPIRVSLRSLLVSNYLEYILFSLEVGYNSNCNNGSPSIITILLNRILFPRHPLNPNRGNLVYIKLRS